MTYDKFFDFSQISYLQSIRPGKKPGEPQVHQLRALKYTPEAQILFKIDHTDEFKALPQRIKKLSKPYEITKLFPQRLKIKKSKFDHLQQLKSVIPVVYHAFYNDIPH